MSIPLPNLLPEDVQAICDETQDTIRTTEHVCTSTNINEVDQHQTRIEKSASGLDTLLGYLNRQLAQMKNSIEAVKAMEKDLARHEKRCTRHYWLVRNGLKKTGSSS